MKNKQYTAFRISALMTIAALFIPTGAFAATRTVTNANDSGFGSLRQRIDTSNSGDIIIFALGLSGSTITVTSELTLNKNNLTIDGDINNDDKADITISGGGTTRVMNITAYTKLYSLNIENGDAGTGKGGGILNTADLTINDSTISNSSAKFGGGIRTSTGTVNLERVTIAGNTATSSGGGLYNLSGDLNLTNSTISGNNTTTNGGGIFTSGSTSDLYIKNSTIAYNICDSDNNNTGEGCGMYSSTSGMAYVANSIISENTESVVGGSVPNQTFSSWGTITSDGYNLIGLGSRDGFTNGVNNDQTTVASGLLALANNGGTTQTHVLDTGSLAIDAGDPAYAGGLTVDQRGTGFNREEGGRIDIGAYEVQVPITLTVTTGEDEVFNSGDLAAETADGDGLALREAIELAGSGDTITFDTAAMGGSTVLMTITAGPYNGDLVLTSSATIDGDLDDDGTPDITIDASGGGRGGRIFATYNAGITTYLDGLILQNGDPTGADLKAGGAILVKSGDMNLVNSIIQNNTGLTGGGIEVATGRVLSVENTVVKNNTAVDLGGGIHSNAATTTITNSTISGNTVTKNTGIYGNGGGVSNKDGTINIINSTISGNTANQHGGGVFEKDGTTNISNSTIAFNISDNDNNTTGDGGGISNLGGTVNLSHTIISDNTKRSDGNATVYDINGTVITQGYNLVKDSTNAGGLVDGVSNDQVGADPLLAALANNGGQTQTHALGTGSLAIDSGDPAYAGGLTIDQCGLTREVGTIDIGSYEYQGSTNTPPTASNKTRAVQC